MITRRRLLGIGFMLFIAVAIVVVCVSLFSGRARSVEFKINSPEPVKINLYRDSDTHAHDIIIADNTPVEASLTTSQILKLKPGAYQAVVADTKNFQALSVDFSVPSTRPITIDPVFSTDRLGSLLRSQRSGIEQAITTNLPQTSHRITSIKLYKDGTWAGAILAPIQTTNLLQLDWQHVVIQKTKGKWKLATKFAIVLDSQTYPTIPKEALDDLNQQQYTPETRDQ